MKAKQRFKVSKAGLEIRISGQAIVRILLLLVVVAVVSFSLAKLLRIEAGIKELYQLENQNSKALQALNATLESNNEQLLSGLSNLEQTRGLRNFLTLAELKQFLADDQTDKILYVKGVFECEEFAMMLQQNAFKQGYILNTQMLFTSHMINLAIVGNTAYYIEPTTDEIIFVNTLD